MDDSRIKDTRASLQEFLRLGVDKYQKEAPKELGSSKYYIERRLYNTAPQITTAPDSIQVTHLREKMTWKRRILRWLEGRFG